jgi:hypothetical protein
MKKIFILGVCICLGVWFIGFDNGINKLKANILCDDLNLVEKLEKRDIRNELITVDFCKINSTITFDILPIDRKVSRADVLRYFIGFHHELVEENFNKVILSFRGIEKLYLDGDEFKMNASKLNKLSYNNQMNVIIYSLKNIDGTSFLSKNTSTGIYYQTQAFNDFNSLSNFWYWNEALN